MLAFQSERSVKAERVHIRAVGGQEQGRVVFCRCPSFTVRLLDHSSLYKFGFCTCMATVFNQEAAKGHKVLGQSGALS